MNIKLSYLRVLIKTDKIDVFNITIYNNIYLSGKRYTSKSIHVNGKVKQENKNVCSSKYFDSSQ